MAQIEELKIMTPAAGADALFMAAVFPQGLAITEYTLQKTRMGMPSLTATLMCERCLDNDWTGKEYVTCQGEKYYIRQKPSSSKSSDDVRYKHELEFVGEREVLAGVYFYDVASVSAAEDYKPRTDMTDFKMVGTLAEYAARLNCSLVYTGVGDSGIRSATASDFAAGRFAARGDGYCVQIPADTEIDLSKYVEVKTEDQYFWDALKAIAEAFETEFAVEGKVIYLAPKEKVLEGFNLEYGADNELVSVRKANKGDKTVNEATAVGSSENIPYYYPNDTEYGVVQVHVSSGNKVLTDLSMLTVSRLSNLLLRARENALVQFHYLQRLDYSASSFQITDSEYNSHDWTTIAAGTPYEMEVEVNVAEGKKKQVPCKFDINVSQAGTYRLGIVGYASSTSRADVDLVKNNLVIMRQCYNAQWEQDTTYANGKIEIEIPNAGTYTVECEIIMGNEEGVELRLDVIKLENQNEDEAYWSCDGSGHYSASVLGISTSVEMGPEADGDSFYWAGTGRMPFQTRLVVPKFRNTQGAERFYRALNNVTGQYAPAYAGYEFPNPYDGIPSQRLYEYEDIKPTMDGVRNIHGQLFGEIAAVAFDDGDNDEVKAVDGESSSNSADYEHSYFYVKLRQMKYSDAAGTWDLDLFGMATQEEAMVLQMTSGRCAGCKFQVQVMADPAPDGRWVNPVQAYENGDIYAGDQYSKISTVESQEWQQDTSAREVWIALKKETETFGVVMPNAEHGYRPQGPHVDSVTGEMVEGDTFNVININLPKCYILAAEERLQAAMMEDMRKDNEDKFVFEASLSRIWAAENPDLAAQIDENTTVRILYNGQEWTQKVSSLTVSASSGDALPEMRLDLSDEIAAEKSFMDQAVAKAVAKTQASQSKTPAVKGEAAKSRSEDGSSADLIKTGDTTAPTDANAYSALRSRKEFVTVSGDQNITGKKAFKDSLSAGTGIDVGSFIEGVSGARIDASGNAEVETLVVRSSLEIGGKSVDKALRLFEFKPTDQTPWDDVTGARPTRQFTELIIGDGTNGVKLTYDPDSKAMKFSAVGNDGGLGSMYADGFVSALGASGSTPGSSSGVDVLSALQDVHLTDSLASGQVLSYDGSHWVNSDAYATRSWVQQQISSSTPDLTDVTAVLLELDARINSLQVRNSVSELTASHVDTETLGAEYAAIGSLSVESLTTPYTTLAQYGITNAYTKTETEQKIAQAIAELFVKEADGDTYRIKALYSLYSVGYLSALGAATASEGGGATALSALSDVALVNAASGDLLSYNGTHWTNIPQSSLQPDLSAYATTAWVQQQGYLTAHQTIYALTLQAGAFAAGTYAPGTAAKTVNIPTTTDHIAEGSNKYFTTQRVTDITYTKAQIDQSVANVSSSLQSMVADLETGATAALLELDARLTSRSVLNSMSELSLSHLDSETAGIEYLTADTINVGYRIEFGDSSHWIELTPSGFHFSHGIYSESFITALGLGGSQSANVGLLKAWGEAYADTDALSAALGVNLNARVSALEGKTGLEQFQFVQTGTGNAVTSVAWANNTLTVTKGSTFALQQWVSDTFATASSLSAYALANGSNATGTWGISISGNAATATAVAWSGITGKPTTISGYGITDAYTKTQTDSLVQTASGALEGKMCAALYDLDARIASRSVINSFSELFLSHLDAETAGVEYLVGDTAQITDLTAEALRVTGKRIYFGSSDYYVELTADNVFHFNAGLYSDSFVSALGRGATTTAGGTLYDLTDTQIVNAASGQVLVYDGTKWRNQDQSTIVPATYALTLQPGSFGSASKAYLPTSSALTVSIPTATSHLSNDSGFITSSYAYSKAEADSVMANAASNAVSLSENRACTALYDLDARCKGRQLPSFSELFLSHLDAETLGAEYLLADAASVGTSLAVDGTTMLTGVVGIGTGAVSGLALTVGGMAKLAGAVGIGSTPLSGYSLFVNGMARIADTLVLPNSGGDASKGLAFFDSGLTARTALALYDNNGSRKLYLGDNTAKVNYDSCICGYNLYFKSGSAPSAYAVLDVNGNFGVGTTSPTYRLDVSGTVQFYNTGNGTDLIRLGDKANGRMWAFKVFNDAANNRYGLTLQTFIDGKYFKVLTQDGSDAVAIYSANSGSKMTVSGDILATGAVTALVASSSSDIRLKRNVRRGALDLESIAKVLPASFEFIAAPGKRHVGVIAQDLQKMLPEAVCGGEYLSVEYGNAAMYLVLSLAQEVARLKREIKQLKNS